MITIVNYNMGNIRSVEKAFQRIAVPVKVSSSNQEILEAEKLLLPGVGHFTQGMMNLTSMNLIETLSEAVLVKKTPILGICLGMQLMTQFSEEGNVDGLNWVKASTKKFCFNDNSLKIPHMGWNTLTIKNNETILKNIETQDLFYFVHSYFVECEHENNILSYTSYGKEFVSAFQKDHIFGCQFHPEKSYESGLNILKNFATL